MRQKPIEQDKFERRQNFNAVEENLTPEQVKEEAARCLNCKNPRCVQGCPVNIQIPDFIKALKEDKLDEAVKYFNLAIDENDDYSSAYEGRNQAMLENHLKIIDLQDSLKKYF